MNRHLIYILVLVIAVLTASDRLTAGSAGSYSNADLDKYKGDVNGVIIPETPPQAPVKKEKQAKKGKDDKSKEYWCSKGSSRRAKADRARANVETAEQRLAEISDQPSREKSLSNAEKKVRSAKKELFRAEQELASLEQTAQRQNIPPGWLRCQFSY